jgi:hypothetical protein
MDDKSKSSCGPTISRTITMASRTALFWTGDAIGTGTMSPVTLTICRGFVCTRRPGKSICSIRLQTLPGHFLSPDILFRSWLDSCGSPDKQANSTLQVRGQRIGANANYNCPLGSVLLGDETRVCQSTGFWSGMAPACRHVDCGPLADLEHGRVQMKHSHFNASALYECDSDYLLVGAPVRTCQGLY